MKVLIKRERIFIMKGIIKGLAVAAMAFLPLAASAQKNIDSAVNTFGANTGKYGIWNKVEDRDDGGAYCITYKFQLPKKEEKKIDFLRKAFYEDVSDAYDVFIKKAGDKTKSNKLIAYGDNLDKRLTLGWASGKDNTDKNYLFMWVNSKENADYRYVYGLEWEYIGNKVCGSVVKIYSRNPQKAKKEKITIVNDQVGVEADLEDLKSIASDMKDLGNSMKELKSLGKITKMFGGKLRSGNDVIEQKDGKMVIRSGKQNLVINADGSIDMDDGEGNKMSLDGNGNVTNMTKGTDSSDPVQEFGNLRAAYLNNIREGNVGNTTMLTGLANSILDLCKQKGQQMTASEKQLCIEGLKDMQEQTPDKFIKGIFGVAISELNKYSKK